MPRRASKKVQSLDETPESATAGEAEAIESIEARDEEFEAMGVLPLRKFFKRPEPGEDPPNIATYNGMLLTINQSTDKRGGENLLLLPQKGPFLLVAKLDVEADDGGMNRRAIAKNGGKSAFQAVIVQYAIGMDPEPQLWARDIHNLAWLLIEPATEYKQMFDRAIQAATLVYGVLDLEDDFAEKRKVLEVKDVLFQYAMRTGSGLSKTAIEELFASCAEEMITHCLGDDVTKGRVIVKFLKESFPNEFRCIQSLCNTHKKSMAKAIKYLETQPDEEEEEEEEDGPTEVPSSLYPPDTITSLEVNAKAFESAEKANLPCYPTAVVIYKYIVIHGITNCGSILYRDWSIARPETANYMVTYWAPRILEYMADETSKEYLELKNAGKKCKPQDRIDAANYVKKNNPQHHRGRLGHKDDVSNEQRRLISVIEWLREALAYDYITHRQKPIPDWQNFIFLRDRIPPDHRIKSAQKIVPKDNATAVPAFSSPSDEDVIMEDVAPATVEDGIVSRSREPSPAPGAEERMPLSSVAHGTSSSLKPAGKIPALKPSDVKPSRGKRIREREVVRRGDGLVNEHGKKQATGRPRKAGPSAPALSSQLRLSESQPQFAGLDSPIADNKSPSRGFMSGIGDSQSSSFGSSRPLSGLEFTRLCFQYYPAQANSPPALDSSSSTTASHSASPPPPNPIVANEITADRIKFRPLPDGSYNCTIEGCAHIEYEPRSKEGCQRMLDHFSTHEGYEVDLLTLVQGEEMLTGRTTGFLQEKLRDSKVTKVVRTVPVKPIRRSGLF